MLSTIGWGMTSVGARTMRVTIENRDEMDRRLAAGEGQILAGWHGRTLVPLFLFRNKGFVTVISPSRDGEIMSRLHRRFGWQTVRGSSGRDAARATLGSIRHLREGHTLAITPDGPKGPAGVVQPGTFYLARKSGCPVVPVGISAWPAWQINSWDTFLIPKPFARAAVIFGDPMFVPPDASTAWLQEATDELGDVLDSLQARADRLVGYPDSGTGHTPRSERRSLLSLDKTGG